MNPPLPDWHRRKLAALIALVGVSFVLGVVEIALALHPEDGGARMLFAFCLLVIGFRWLQLDAAELEIRRPVWLNVGIVLLAAVFVPYYLYKTRPAGLRLQAISAFFGIVFACVIASALGAALMSSISGTPPAT